MCNINSKFISFWNWPFIKKNILIWFKGPKKSLYPHVKCFFLRTKIPKNMGIEGCPCIPAPPNSGLEGPQCKSLHTHVCLSGYHCHPWYRDLIPIYMGIQGLPDFGTWVTGTVPLSPWKLVLCPLIHTKISFIHFSFFFRKPTKFYV
jgi:hypothetical protein